MAQHKWRLRRPDEPHASHHGAVASRALSAAGYSGHSRAVPLRNIGTAISPFNAWLILPGIETLSLCMEPISDNAQPVARPLMGNARSLPTHPVSTTHRQWSSAELLRPGGGADTLRLSPGIGRIDGLFASLEPRPAVV